MAITSLMSGDRMVFRELNGLPRQSRGLKRDPRSVENSLMGETAGSWLCPTESDRTRALEAGARVRVARTVATAACAVALITAAPWTGWWTLGLLAAVALNLATLESRLKRSARPEWVAARSMLLVLALLAVGAALTGGQDSPFLPWLIFPSATSSARFRPQAVTVGAGITAAAMIGVSLGVDAAGVLDDPTRLIMAVTLLAGVTAITTALMHGELENRDRAVLDPLTGLLNRASLASRVSEIEQQARLTGGPVSVVLLDLDSFKLVNDEYGHERGDAVLRDTAYEMRKSLRSFELVYRIGGEEFLLLLPGLELGDAVEIAERIRRSTGEARPGDLELTLSAGVASGAGSTIAYDELFRAADAALLEAKRGGRNRVVAASDEPPFAMPDARRFAADVTAAPLA